MALKHEMTESPPRGEEIQKIICLVQLARFGDLLQTSQATFSLKKNNPEIKLVLVSRKKFSEPLSFLLDGIFDEIIELDIEEMFEGADSFHGVKKNISAKLDALNKLNIDVLINLSGLRSSAYLCGLIKSKNKLGMYRNFANGTCIDDRWSQIIYSSVMRGADNPFNLVDIYKGIIGVSGAKSSPIIKNEPDGKTIVMHLFASQDKKIWSGDKWVEVIYKLFKAHECCDIVLVGSRSEEKAAEKIIQAPLLNKFKKRIISRVGETDFEQLCSLIAKSILFVGHDSAISHLASLSDIPIVVLALGTVRPRETAPYSENAYVIAPKTKCFPCFPDEKCDFYQCHVDVSYGVVFEVISSILKEGSVSPNYLSHNLSKFLTDKVSVFKTETTNANFISLREITSHEVELREVIGVFYRISCLFVFYEIEENWPEPSLSRQGLRELNNIVLGIEQFYELSEFGKKYAMKILEEVNKETPSLSKIKFYSDKIGEIDDLQEILAKTYPALRFVIEYFKVRHSNIPGDNIVDVARGEYLCHDEASTFCSIIYDLSKKVLKKRSEIHRPIVGVKGV